jgi:tRNA (guanine-N7-)-methyltransferase
MMPAGNDRKPAPRFDWHGRRQGRKLRAGRRRLVDELLPRLQLTLPADHGAIDPGALFTFAPRQIWLEIGFGGGEHLAGQAARHPDIGFIGCEVFLNGVAAALAHLQRAELENVRLLADDARRLMPRLPEGGVHRVYLLFSDPWPKRRHRDRRFTGLENLKALARIMADGAELRVASDDAGFIRWTLEQVRRCPDLRWLARRPADWRAPPADWIETRYQQKAERAGRRPMFLAFQRRPRGPGNALEGLGPYAI